MKRINIKDFNTAFGTLIDIEEEIIYKKKHIDGSINIPYDKLMYNYKTLLDKNKKYFIICSGGRKSKRAVGILEFYGYDVTQVYKE